MKILINATLVISLCLYSLCSFALANPASVNCVNQGNQLVLIRNVGICIFPDNSYCEEWAYFRGNCKKGQNAFPGGKFDKTNLQQYCITRVNNTSFVSLCRMN